MEVIVRTLGSIVLLIMGGALVYGFVAGTGFGVEGSQLLDLAWGRVTVVDLYLMLAVFAVWIWRREPNRLHALLWSVSLVVLGSLAAGAYLLVAAVREPRRAEI